MKELTVTDVNLFGMSITTNRTLKPYKTYRLCLNADLQGKTVNCSLRIMLFDMSARDSQGYASYRVGYRRLKNSQLKALKEITEFFETDADKREMILDLVKATIG